jgi:D-lactate dehydrogenase
MANIALFHISGWERDYLSQKLAEAGHAVDVYEYSLDESHLPEKRDYDAISVFVGSQVTPAVIDAFPDLKLITTRSTGYDHIDAAYAKTKGVAVGYVPNYGENTVAEFAVGLLLTVSRKLYMGIDRIKETAQFSYEGLEGFDLKGKTVGIIGTGRIGAHVMRMLKGFDVKIIAYDVFPRQELAAEIGFSYVSLDELLAAADIISLHCPFTPDTVHLLNADAFSKMKKGVVLINTARGALIDTAALVRALQDGTVAGAGLDVLEEEGIASDEMGYLMHNGDAEKAKTMLANHVLMDMPSVVITPHNAFNTKEAKTRILDADMENIALFFASLSPKFPVSL